MRISGPWVRRSAPQSATAKADGNGEAAAAAVPVQGRRSVPGVVLANSTSWVSLAPFRATAATVAPRERSVRAGPSSDVAPTSAKANPDRSSHSGWSASSRNAAAASGSISSASRHRSTCATAAAPSTAVPPGPVGRETVTGRACAAPFTSTVVKRGALSSAKASCKRGGRGGGGARRGERPLSAIVGRIRWESVFGFPSSKQHEESVHAAIQLRAVSFHVLSPRTNSKESGGEREEWFVQKGRLFAHCAHLKATAEPPLVQQRSSQMGDFAICGIMPAEEASTFILSDRPSPWAQSRAALQISRHASGDSACASAILTRCGQYAWRQSFSFRIASASSGLRLLTEAAQICAA